MSGSGADCVDDSDTKPRQCPTGFIEMVAGGPMCMSSSGQTMGKECPSGYTLRYNEDGMGDPTCRKTTPVSCPAGSDLAELFFSLSSPPKGVCLQSTAPSYTRPAPTRETDPFPCNAGDPFVSILPDGARGTPVTEVKCYGTGAGSSTTTQAAAASTAATPPVNPPFATLDTNYQEQVAAYEAAVNASIQQNDPSRLQELRTMSEGIQTTLNKMIENLTYLKRETPDLKAERDKLLADLRRIQQDYSAMLSNTDDLETLRRIRQQENGEARRMLLIYLMAFLFMSCMLLVYIVYTGRKTPTSATTAATPTMSPALT